MFEHRLAFLRFRPEKDRRHSQSASELSVSTRSRQFLEHIGVPQIMINARNSYLPDYNLGNFTIRPPFKVIYPQGESKEHFLAGYFLTKNGQESTRKLFVGFLGNYQDYLKGIPSCMTHLVVASQADWGKNADIKIVELTKDQKYAREKNYRLRRKIGEEYQIMNVSAKNNSFQVNTKVEYDFLFIFYIDINSPLSEAALRNKITFQVTDLAEQAVNNTDSASKTTAQNQPRRRGIKYKKKHRIRH